MKRILFLILLGGFALSLNSCAGYVSEPPSYVEIGITPRPYNNYIWIEGGWRWDNSRKVYVQRRGHWEKPDRARNYKKGQWKKYDRGYRWEKRDDKSTFDTVKNLLSNSKIQARFFIKICLKLSKIKSPIQLFLIPQLSRRNL